MVHVEQGFSIFFHVFVNNWKLSLDRLQWNVQAILEL